MTVKQLKDKLSQYPDDMKVLTFNYDKMGDVFNDKIDLRPYRATKAKYGYIYCQLKPGEIVEEVLVIW